MGWKKWFLGLLWLVAAPSLVLALFAGWTYVLASEPQAGPLRVTAEPNVVWPWKEAELRLSVQEEESPSETPEAEPIDMVLLVDVSGSMLASLDDMSDAVRSVVSSLADGRNRFALVRFDSEAITESGWTTTAADLDAGLGSLAPMTGQNSTGPAFEHLEALLGEARADATSVVVWYTDGALDACLCPSMSNDQIAAASEDLRDRGIELFAVAPPTFFRTASPLLARMTGSPTRVFEPRNVTELGRSFQAVATGIWNSVGRQGRLEQRIDGRHFATPLGGTEWRRGADGTLVRDLDLLLDGGTYPLPLEPRSAGLWRVGLEPPLLSYEPDGASGLVERRAQRRPPLLVLTWWTLIWAYLPALLWALANLPRREVAQELEMAPLPPVPSPSLPGRLPAIPASVRQRLDTVPTLFLGLGGAGRRALEDIRAELDELRRGQAGPWEFLGLDLDRRPPEESASPEGDGLAQPPTRTVLAAPAVARVGGYLPTPGQVPEAWSWFDAVRYHDMSREDLNLVDGARGDRALARLAFFRWLDQGGLLDELRAAMKRLASRPAADGLRQVIIVANRDGGLGSGAVIDLGRISQRLGRELQDGGEVDFAPEVIGLLSGDADRPHDENRQTLALELQTAMLAGAHPQRTDYGDTDPISSATDREAPFHILTSVAAGSGEGARGVADQAAQLAAALVEGEPRRGVLRNVAELAPGDDACRPVEICSSSLQRLPALARRRRQLYVLERLLGPDVLFDIVPRAGGYEPRPVADDEVEAALDRWASEEAVGGPLALLLAARGGATAAVQSLEAAAVRWPPDVDDWLESAMLAAVGRRLHGSDRGGGWRRDWGPSLAHAVFRRLGRQMAGLGQSSGLYSVLARRLAEHAESLGEALESWLQEGCEAGAALAAERRAIKERIEHLGALSHRFLMEEAETSEETEEEIVRRLLEGWLGGVDTVALLRQHLFPAFEADSGTVRVVVRDHVEEPRAHHSLEDLLRRLRELGEQLANSQGDGRLEEAPDLADDERRRSLARALVDLQSRPDRVLLTRPRSLAGAATPHLDALEEAIPHPAGHGGERRRLDSGDDATLRRLEVTVEPPAEDAAGVGFAHGPELAAERMRRQMEREFQIAVPVLPAALRLALARPERFQDFAAAFRAGRVVRRADEAGGAQWYSEDEHRFLTFGRRSTLADAAAAFTQSNGASTGAPTTGVASDPGDFSAFESWRREGGKPVGDVPVLAAIMIAVSRS